VSADSPSPGSRDLSLATVGAAVVAAASVVVAGALVFFAVRARRVRHVCGACGVRVAGSADRCPACRHDAAVAARQTANKRAEQRRAAEAEERRRREGEEQRLETLRRAEQGQRRRLDEERKAEEESARREETARRGAEKRQRAEAAASSDAQESAFDPYVVLGVPPGASDEEVRAAYEQAKVKYDPEEVAHLGDDAKRHFAAKSRAIERAYRMLADEIGIRLEELGNRVIG
jgi:DnaJ-domain-containing protein 1